MTPAGTSNELDVQNGWEENTHTHKYIIHSKSPTYELVGRTESILNIFHIKVQSPETPGGAVENFAGYT